LPIRAENIGITVRRVQAGQNLASLKNRSRYDQSRGRRLAGVRLLAVQFAPVVVIDGQTLQSIGVGFSKRFLTL
jgi:hypothetical protein